ncbi:MAG TPA: zinc-ribbon domain-containing protein [Clostridia bacterium]|nr:zinc-ribbon domain-containing protein [Clostridia bacterium]
MAFCNNCGAEVNGGAKFCPSCGATVNNAAPQQNAAYSAGAQTAPALDDAQQNKAMGVLAYLGFLVLVPLFAAPNSQFARYHANQGLVLALAEIAYGILVAILTPILWAISWTIGSIMSTVFSILWLAFLVFMILGIMNAAKGETKPLPLIGGIKLLK